MEEKSVKGALQELHDFGQEMEEIMKEDEARVDAWWDSLTEEEREDAFYAVVKRIYKAEVLDRGTYRYALYDIFGFDGGMYMRGMDCGYMNLHNILFDGQEFQRMEDVTRLEVIDDTGRAYVKYMKDDEKKVQRPRFVLQDDDRTLKIFVDDWDKVGV
jgi:hypothetical protein